MGIVKHADRNYREPAKHVVWIAEGAIEVLPHELGPFRTLQ